MFADLLIVFECIYVGDNAEKNEQVLLFICSFVHSFCFY